MDALKMGPPFPRAMPVENRHRDPVVAHLTSPPSALASCVLNSCLPLLDRSSGDGAQPGRGLLTFLPGAGLLLLPRLGRPEPGA